jgi:hypothetical protein
MKHAAAILLAVTLGLVGCASDPLRPPPGEQFVQLRRSPAARVVMENGLDREVRVLANTGEASLARAIAPGARLALRFHVAEVAKISDMSPGASGWLVPREGAGLLMLDGTDDHAYLDMKALRVRVRVDTGDASAWEYLIEPGDCVFAREASATITIEQRPRAIDPPTPLCEDGAY